MSIDRIKDKLESDNLKQVITVAVERIFWGASDRKVRRFAAVVANAIEAGEKDQDFEDAALYIHALDELSEDDIKVLTHLYKHQGILVEEKHAMPYNSFFQNNGMRKMIEDAANLGIQIDEFYARCSRLGGYGLALPLDKSHGSMGNPDNFAFRLTLLGKRLVNILTRAEVKGGV